jgi:hypothetical protein
MKFRIVSLTILCLTLAVVPALADTLYSNGPYNGTVDAWIINFGFSVSDSFTVVPNSTITGLDFVYWDASSTALVTTVDLQVGATSFGGTKQTLTVNTNTFLGMNQYGYNLYEAIGSTSAIAWPDAGGYATLSNACTNVGCTVTTQIFWDENSGPSTAYENAVGSIPSEAFTLTGTPGGELIPEPNSVLLFGSGILGFAGVLRKGR